jgi:hypothetical protein
MENYILYGEWDDPRGESETEAAALDPNYRTNVLRCGWCEAWKKHGLLEYGRIYCECADENLVRGFSHGLTLKMGSILSFGGNACEFDWIGCKFPDTSSVAKKRRQKIPRVTKDFLYHCGHLLSTARREIIFELGLPEGEEIIWGALAGYKKTFGALKNKALIQETSQNFMPLYLGSAD